MKRNMKFVCGIILLVGISSIGTNVFSQSMVCNYCGIPLSGATKNSDHKQSCKYYSPPQKSTATTTSVRSSSSPPTTIGATSTSETIIQYVVPLLLSSPDPKQVEAERKAKAIESERIAAENARKKLLQDSIDLVKHNTLMESYKTLPGSTSVGFKGLPTSTGKVAKTEPLDGTTVALKEQEEFEKDTATWIGFQKKLFSERLKSPNKWASNLSESLASYVPPLDNKKFDELQPGDVLLIAPTTFDPSKVVRWADRIASGSLESKASHTVTFIKEVNGQKLFLDNQPFAGPIIISEKQLLEKYGHRNMDVAQFASFGVAQPLNDLEAEKLFKAAVKMQSDNLNAENSNYGAWGKNDLVCSESSWALIQASGRKISGTDFGLKSGIGIDFSPADFYAQKQYFLVTPLSEGK